MGQLDIPLLFMNFGKGFKERYFEVPPIILNILIIIQSKLYLEFNFIKTTHY